MTTARETAGTPIDDLCERLQLEALDRDLFLANPGPGSGRLFGGLVAAQSVRAAMATLAERETEGSAASSLLHSVHAYFLRPGRYDLPIRFVVDRIRDGRTFTTRRIVAHQAGEAIFNMAASFARPEEGMAYQRPMPERPRRSGGGRGNEQGRGGGRARARAPERRRGRGLPGRQRWKEVRMRLRGMLYFVRCGAEQTPSVSPCRVLTVYLVATCYPYFLLVPCQSSYSTSVNIWLISYLSVGFMS